MHRALLKLLRLRLRGTRRKMFRGVRTLRGAAFFGLGAILMALWIGQSLFMAVANDQRSDPETVRTYVPLALLGICLMNVLTGSRQKSVNFTPAEVDFLFSGPFTRRELLAYKLSGGAAGGVLVALIFSVVFLRHATLWIAALTGCFLAILFVQLFCTAVVLIGQTVAEHVYTRLRRLVLLAVVALLALGGWQAASAGAEQGWHQIIREFQTSTIGGCVLAPFEVFARTFTAERLIPDLVGFGAMALIIDLALLALVMRLDVNYMESALAVSQKLYQRMQRARRGGVAWAATQGKARWSVPQLPWLGGIGPIAWKQVTVAVRTARGLLIVLAIMAAVATPTFLTLGESQNAWIGPVTGNLVFLTVLLTRMMPFDFRGDLDHIDWLKSLPLGSTAIAAGQLVTPVLMMSAFHFLILGGLALGVPDSRNVAAAVAAFVPPFNFLLFGLENLIFLRFPARMVATTPGDFQFFGRVMVEMLLKMIILAACCGLAAALGGVAYLICGHSWIAALTVAWLALASAAGGTVPCVAWAYRRFDVSLDTP